MFTIEVRQLGITQVILQGESYSLCPTRNPKGMAVMVEDAAMYLFCPGCGEPIESGDSENCACYRGSQMWPTVANAQEQIRQFKGGVK